MLTVDVLGEFYGPNMSPANLELLSRFYQKYPEYADKTFLSVKVCPKSSPRSDVNSIFQGGLAPARLGPDGSSVFPVTLGALLLTQTPTLGSPENLRRSVTFINEKLGGIKKMDLFEPARVPTNVPLEDMIKSLVELKNEGHFQHIGLSECSAATLRKAHAVYPITAVEIEVSMWSYEEETKRGESLRGEREPFDVLLNGDPYDSDRGVEGIGCHSRCILASRSRFPDRHHQEPLRTYW